MSMSRCAYVQALPAAIGPGGFRVARVCANVATCAAISSPGSTSFTRPVRRAHAASFGVAREQEFHQVLAPDARETVTAGVVQKPPLSTPGRQKVAVSDAKARSQAVTSCRPAAVAMPSTRAMVGLGGRW